MRFVPALGILVFCTLSSHAQAPRDSKLAKRYGFEASARNYPQATPQEALGSIIKAIDKRRIDYLLAQLADPDFVDERVKRVYAGSFDELVQESTTKLADNPGSVDELRRFAKEGEWKVTDNQASASLKEVKGRQVFLRKLENRWFLENRQQGEAPKADSQEPSP